MKTFFYFLVAISIVHQGYAVCTSQSLTDIVCPSENGSISLGIGESTSNWTVLKIVNSRLTSLSSDAFILFPKLTLLDLVKCGINSFQHDTFKPLNSLEILHLAENAISTSTLSIRAFEHLARLKELNLVRNQLTTLNRNCFAGLFEVKKLWLSHNNIINIEGDTFSDMVMLQYLDMSHNNVRSLTSFVFSGLNNLLELWFHHNDISRVEPDAFIPLGNLIELDFSNNNIGGIPNDATKGLNSLKRFWLKNNNIKSVGPYGFSGVPNLRNLDLSHNLLSSIGNGQEIIPIKNLTILSLNNNKITDINIKILNILSYLEELHIANNRITYLGDLNTRDLKNLKVINFAGNPLNCACFKNLINWIYSRNVDFQKGDIFSGKKPICISNSNNLTICSPIHDEILINDFLTKIAM